MILIFAVLILRLGLRVAIAVTGSEAAAFLWLKRKPAAFEPAAFEPAPAQALHTAELVATVAIGHGA